MNSEVLFSEKQRFDKWWVWAIALIVCAIPAWDTYTKTIGQGVGTSDPASYFGLGIALLLMILFLSAKLEMEISNAGITVRFIPFIWKRRFYAWDLVEKAYLREYKPIGEFGGWGIRGFGKNRALNVSGNKGLQLVFKDGKRLLIGTRKTDEITRVLKLLGKRVDH